MVTGSFVDYLVPSAADLPNLATEATETPATTNPLGVKGVGEAGAIASTPAVVNAVVDAVRHLGIHDIPNAVYAASGLVGDPERLQGRCDARQQSDGRRQRLAVSQCSNQRWRCSMIPAPFDYVAPESVADALAALRSDSEEIKVIAGGQSLLPVLKLRLAAPTLLVDLSHTRSDGCFGGRRLDRDRRDDDA